MIYRYEPRFFEAMRRAVGREQEPQSYPALRAWLRRTVQLVNGVYAAADRAGLDEAARRSMILHIDKRDMRVETLLSTIRYHAAKEYPFLLQDETEHSLTAIYASNLNDRYLALRLAQAGEIEDAELRRRIAQLRDHLDAIPPSGT